MELYCTPKFNTQLLITISSTPNTTGATSLFRSQNTTGSSSIEASLDNNKRYYGNQLLLVKLLHDNETNAVQYCCVAKERNNVALEHCYEAGHRRHDVTETITCNNIYVTN
jgi:hypothetical protein